MRSLQYGQDGVTRVMYKMFEEVKRRGNEAIAIGAALPEEEHRIIPMYKAPSVALPLQKAYRLALPSYQPFAKYLHDFQPDIIHINSPCPLGYSASRFCASLRHPGRRHLPHAFSDVSAVLQSRDFREADLGYFAEIL